MHPAATLPKTSWALILSLGCIFDAYRGAEKEWTKAYFKYVEEHDDEGGAKRQPNHREPFDEAAGPVL